MLTAAVVIVADTHEAPIIECAAVGPFTYALTLFTMVADGTDQAIVAVALIGAIDTRTGSAFTNALATGAVEF